MTSAAHKKQPLKQSSLARSTGKVGFMTLLSRVLGFLRDMVAASLFGATGAYDAFLVAFKIPNFLRRLSAEGCFSQAFVPLLSEQQMHADEADLRSFIDGVAGCLFVVVSIITLIGVIAAPILIWLFAPGFGGDPVRFGLATTMLRITFPYLLLISLTAFFGAILNAHGRFGVPAFSPVFLNVAMIACSLGLGRFFDVPEMALAWGVFLGGVLQLACHIPFLMQINKLPRLRPNFSDPRVKRLLQLMLPALFGVSVVQINLLMDTIFVSLLPVGSVSWLYYADRVMEFPLGIFGVALATTVLPHLSRSKANGQHDSYGSTLDWAIRMVLLVGAPAAIGLGVMAGPLVSTLFQHGEFGVKDVLETAPALQAYAVGLFWFILVKILASGYYACQDLATPVKCGIVSLVVNFCLNVILVKHFHQVGLATSTAIAAFVNCGMLFSGLMRRGLLTWQPGWTRYLARFVMALICMTLYLLLATPDTEAWMQMTTFERSYQLGIAVSAAVVIYFGTLWLTGLRAAHLRSPSVHIT